MAKALALSPDALNAPQITPKAATPARSAAATSEPKVSKKKTEQMFPLQIRIPKEDLKAIKMAATSREITVSEFMLACFHASMKS